MSFIKETILEDVNSEFYLVEMAQYVPRHLLREHTELTNNK